MSTSSLHELLRDRAPRDFSLAKAWTALIRAQRRQHRESAWRGMLASRAQVERARGRAVRDGVDAELDAIKQALRDVLRGAEPGVAARRVDELVGAVLRSEASGSIAFVIDGWPFGFGAEERRRLLAPWPGAAGGALDAPLLASLRRDLDGLRLGGSRLRVRVQLPADTELPPPPRAARDRSRRGRPDPWLPHTDGEGLRSLTSQRLAARQAARLEASEVVDAFCGVGGSAVALARSGKRVWALELDARRARLARRNADQLGLGGRISVEEGDAYERLTSLLAEHPRAALFLDPPWGDAAGEVRKVSWVDLLGGLELPAREVVVKAPPELDLATLPGEGWAVHYEFGEYEDNAALVRMLTLVRPA